MTGSLETDISQHSAALPPDSVVRLGLTRDAAPLNDGGCASRSRHSLSRKNKRNPSGKAQPFRTVWRLSRTWKK